VRGLAVTLPGGLKRQPAWRSRRRVVSGNDGERFSVTNSTLTTTWRRRQARQRHAARRRTCGRHSDWRRHWRWRLLHGGDARAFLGNSTFTENQSLCSTSLAVSNQPIDPAMPARQRRRARPSPERLHLASTLSGNTAQGAAPPIVEESLSFLQASTGFGAASTMSSIRFVRSGGHT